MHSPRVAGEPLDTLIEALQHVEVRRIRDGMTSMSMRLEPRLGDPFLRALMRVQAELVRDDADRLGVDHWEERTQEQRAADAFVALALRVAAAAADGDGGAYL
jgi:hypothetical protein